MKTIVTAAIVAIGLAAGTIGSRAQAEIVWHFPYKGTPYATQTTPTAHDYRAWRGHYRSCRVLRRSGGKRPCQKTWH
jgi:hypothetical protein